MDTHSTASQTPFTHPFHILSHYLSRSFFDSEGVSWTLIPQLLDEAAMLDHDRIQSFDFFRSAVINNIRKKVDREGN